jgi:hypothetical protein
MTLEVSSFQYRQAAAEHQRRETKLSMKSNSKLNLDNQPGEHYDRQGVPTDNYI